MTPAPTDGSDNATGGTRRKRVARLPAPAILLGLGLLLPILLVFTLPLFSSLPTPVGGNVLDADLPMLSQGHPLGTDANGNDVLARLVHGGMTSLRIALAVNLIGLLLGGSIGAMSAYYGGVIDNVLMRALDVLIAFPSLILVLAVAQALAPSEINTIWALSFFSVPAFARVARSATIVLREQPFITAAQLCGTPTWRILARHIAPNIVPQLSAFALLGAATVINIEGAVSFLGLGVPLPQPSLGNMISQGQQMLSISPSLVLLPSVFLFLTVLSFNLIGEALRERWSAS